jgi:hypothetical protein
MRENKYKSKDNSVYLKNVLRINKYGKYEQHQLSFNCASCHIFHTLLKKKSSIVIQIREICDSNFEPKWNKNKISQKKTADYGNISINNNQP